MNKHYDIIIVGGGPAGLTAAIYARRAGKSVLVLERPPWAARLPLRLSGQLPRSPWCDRGGTGGPAL